MRRCVAAGLAFVLALMLAAPAMAGEPTMVIERSVNEILDILRDPAMEGNAEARTTRIYSVVESVFDMRVFSIRTLGKNWRTLSKEQQDEFTQLYSDLLKRTYRERLESYSDEEVIIDGEKSIAANKVEVQTTVISAGTRIPVAYRLYQKGGDWMVYDVLVEGVSLVKNYRSQFNEVLSKKSPDELLAQLRKKLSS